MTLYINFYWDINVISIISIMLNISIEYDGMLLLILEYVHIIIVCYYLHLRKFY